MLANLREEHAALLEDHEILLKEFEALKKTAAELQSQLDQAKAKHNARINNMSEGQKKRWVRAKKMKRIGPR